MMKYFARKEACKLAAIAMQGACGEGHGDIGQRLWSLAVFFEMYLTIGAEGTRADFGPKEPTELRMVK